jgi:undecaprenyl-diphosphatase
MDRRRQPSIPSAAQIAVASAIGLTLSGGLTYLAAGDNTLPGDVAVARAVQGTSVPDFSWLAQGVNWIGAGPQLTVISLFIVTLLILHRTPHLALFLLVATTLRSFNSILKAIAGSPRPSDALISVTERANGSGFPSGHAMGAMLVYGGFALLAECAIGRIRARRFAQGCALLMVVLTGLSRVYTGAHWPSDVLGGFLWGLTLLLALLAVTERFGKRHSRPFVSKQPAPRRFP